MNLIEGMETAIIHIMPPESVKSYKAAREQQKVVEDHAIAVKNEECAKAIENLSHALRSRYNCRSDIEDAMQALNRAHAAALIVDPLDAA